MGTTARVSVWEKELPWRVTIRGPKLGLVTCAVCSNQCVEMLAYVVVDQRVPWTPEAQTCSLACAEKLKEQWIQNWVQWAQAQSATGE